MAPWVRRTWSPRGCTPILYQRGRSHQKVSAIAALVVSPQRTCVRCFFRLYPDANITTPLMVSFLKQLARQLKERRFLVIWDRLNVHRARPVQIFLSSYPAVGTAFLPAYAPELNPVEMVWNYLKTNPLANDPHKDLPSLISKTRRCGRSLQHKGNLLRSFIQHGTLFLSLK